MHDLTVAVRPPWPYRLPGAGRDGILRSDRAGTLRRLLHVDGRPVVVSAWQPAPERVMIGASRSERPGDLEVGGAGLADLEVAVERMRFALGVDDDLSELYAAFKRDPLLGPAVRARPWHRPRRRPWAWEALAWAVTEQLIESPRAAAIQRRIARRWGRRCPGAGASADLHDIPSPATIAGLAPAELAALDLAPSRALALIRCAREVAAGRVDPAAPAGDRRLLRIPGIGPWTLQCLGLHGRGDPDALPAGDLAYIKLVGRLARLGRRATIAEVEELLVPYAPYRGLVGSFLLAHWHTRAPHAPAVAVPA